MPYDSSGETLKHVHLVRDNILEVIGNLQLRLENHDNSKFEIPEKEAFDSLGPPEEMAKLVYGSEEYKANFRKIKPAIQHHYQVNDHHPEHFDEKGISGMSLMGLLEMLADWRAAGKRHATGNLGDSLAKNKDRFKINDQLQSILESTAKELGWI